MLPADVDTVRLFLHVLAATVWVGGQLSLAFLVPVVRRTGGADTVRAVARRFQQVAWPAFAVLLLTGVWSILAVDIGDRTTEYQVTLFVKLVVVALAGMGAGAHALVTGPAVARAGADEAAARRARARSGMFAGLGALLSIAAVFLGVQLAGG